MSSDTVTEILEEVAPTAGRGLPMNSAIESMGCAEVRRTDYLDMTLARQRDNCDSPNPEHEVRATITYKRDVCRVPMEKVDDRELPVSRVIEN
jgi:hypothetical protein